MRLIPYAMLVLIFGLGTKADMWISPVRPADLIRRTHTGG
jgi:hypothetical protein